MISELINVRPDARVKSNGCHGTLEREEWRPVKGYEGLYEVSSFGRVRSLDRWVNHYRGNKKAFRKGQMLKLRTDKDGYVRVGLCIKQKMQLAQVHRLVMEAFVPNPDNLPCVNHRNENKSCNIPDNLEWCTVAYNNTYGGRVEQIANKNRGQKRPQIGEKLRGIVRSEDTKQKSTEAKRPKMKPVLQYTLDGEFVGEYESVKEAYRQTGVHYGNICNCCIGRFHTAGGYIWKYK